MKRVSIQNTAPYKLSIMEVPGLVFAPGEIRKVAPATAMHPAVLKYTARGLLKTVEPHAPAEPTKSVAKEVTAELAAEPMPAPAAPPEKPVDTAGSDTRKTLLTAPGVNEKNVDDILRVAHSLEELRSMDKEDLVDATGISAANAKKLLFWAQSQS